MRTSIIVTVCGVGVIAAAMAAIRRMDRTTAQPVRDLSRMMSVRVTTAKALTAHYEQHGSYPRSLSELPLDALAWEDEGSSPRDLGNWHYHADARSFTMTWTNARGVELFLGGQTGLLHFSREEKQ